MCLLPPTCTPQRRAQPSKAQSSISRSERALDKPYAPALLASLVRADAPSRSQTEEFITQRFRETFNANLAQFMPVLVRLERPDGSLAAALGLRHAQAERLFVEDYLDLPAERSVSQALTRRVTRNGLIEVGNLAIAEGTSGRQVALALARLISQMPCKYLIFAATAPLRASLRRLGIAMNELSWADPQRLGRDAEQWGDYYRSQPQVVCAEVSPGIARLTHRGLL